MFGLHRLWKESRGQGITEYAVMLAVVITLMITILQLIGSHANLVFSHVASTLHP
jgi:Flp pilus assembly pilin Flp